MGKENHIGFQVKKLSNQINRFVAKNMAASGEFDEITANYNWIIGYLCENKDKEIYQKDLEEKFNIAKSTVTSILKQMEKKGLIAREAVEFDGRLKKLTVTEYGESMYVKTKDIIIMGEKKIESCLPAEEIKEYLRITKKLQEALKKEI